MNYDAIDGDYRDYDEIRIEFNWEFIINCKYCESMIIGNCNKDFYKNNYAVSNMVK